MIELGSGELHLQVLWPGGIGRDKGKIDVCFECAGEFDFGFFGGLGKALQRLTIFSQINALIAQKLFGNPIDEALVKIIAAKMGVSGGGMDFKYAIAYIEDGDIKGSAAEIEDQDGLVALFVQAISECSRGGFIDNAKNVEAGDFSGVLSGLALCIIEVGRDSDDCVGNFFAKIFGGVFDQAGGARQRKLLPAGIACP